MEPTTDQKAKLLRKILDAIAGHLTAIENEDIVSFIDAGEYAVATDTIFCAINEDDISINDEVIDDLAQVANLYNTFQDLDPDVVAHVLHQAPRSGSLMR